MQARRYPQFVEASPRGLVPALVHDGVCVNDSVVCCEYLTDISPPGVLLATPAASRAQVRSLRFRERGRWKRPRLQTTPDAPRLCDNTC